VSQQDFIPSASIESISRQLGILIGRSEEQQASIKEIRETVNHIAANSVRIDMLEKNMTLHNDRISLLENNNRILERDVAKTSQSLEQHIERDVPIEIHLGKWALAVVSIIGMYLIEQAVERNFLWDRIVSDPPRVTQDLQMTNTAAADEP
jgi:hypothetical protein